MKRASTPGPGRSTLRASAGLGLGVHGVCPPRPSTGPADLLGATPRALGDLAPGGSRPWCLSTTLWPDVGSGDQGSALGTWALLVDGVQP